MESILAQLFVWYGTHRRSGSPKRTPSHYGLEYKEVIFPSANADNAQLCGWLVSPAAPKGIVLLCHGIDSSASSMLAKAAMLNRNNFTTLLFDFRASGRSGGEHVTLGLHEADDVLGAVRYIDREPSLRDLNIFAIGESMGGSAVIRAAAQSDRIRAVVSESTYATLSDALRQRLKLLGPLASRVEAHCHRIGEAVYGVRISDVDPEREISNLSPRPLLLIHDNLDVLCSRAESDRLFSAAGLPKERWNVPYAPHTFAFMVAPREYERRVVGFLEDACRTENMNVVSRS